MKYNLFLFVLIISSFSLHAEDGHNLWLRSKSVETVSVVCAKSSPVLEIAKQELSQGWRGQRGAKLVLSLKKEKTIKSDGLKLSANEIQANTELRILYRVYELLRRQ